MTQTDAVSPSISRQDVGKIDIQEKLQLPPNLGKALLEPLNHAIAAGEREALKIGVPSTDVIEMLLNHLASVVAMIEPAGARAATIEGLVAGFAPMVQKHVAARYMTPGGILTPRPVEELQRG